MKRTLIVATRAFGAFTTQAADIGVIHVIDSVVMPK